VRDLIKRALSADPLAIAKLITLVENGGEEKIEVLRELYPFMGKAHYIGITGAPGVGKSTLIDKLISQLRSEGSRVGVIAVDPSSPFTGGAFLGDRLRMQRHATDPGVFIRSMGSRGALGGLAKATADVSKVLDACGFDYVIVETVGAGQNEVDIIKTADTVILVLVPGLGDDVQIIKAGIMEIGDIFVINKSDKDGAQRLAKEVEMWMEFGYKDKNWKPPVVMTIAEDGTGVDKLVAEIKRHVSYLRESGEIKIRRKSRVLEEINLALEEVLRKHVNRVVGEETLNNYVDLILEGKLDLYTVVEEIVTKIIRT